MRNKDYSLSLCKVSTTLKSVPLTTSKCMFNSQITTWCEYLSKQLYHNITSDGCSDSQDERAGLTLEMYIEYPEIVEYLKQNGRWVNNDEYLCVCVCVCVYMYMECLKQNGHWVWDRTKMVNKCVYIYVYIVCVQIVAPISGLDCSGGVLKASSSFVAQVNILWQW